MRASEPSGADGLRLQYFLAEAGVASRRAAEHLIAEGRVKVNGRVVTEPFRRVRPGHDRVTVGDKHVLGVAKVYLAVNKPKGVVASMDDVSPEGRPTLRSLLPKMLLQRLAVVGALDLYAEGVVLVTNDGRLAHALTHPSRPVPKTYQVKVKGKLLPGDLDALRHGVRLPRGRSAPAEVDLLRDEGKHTWVQITTEEGRHRIVQRMLEAIGREPLKIARVAFAGVAYLGLRVGEHRQLSDGEISRLRVLGGLQRGES